MMKKDLVIVIVLLILLLISAGSIFEDLHAAGIQIEELETPLETSEGGDEAAFWVTLANPPECPTNCFVEVNVSSLDFTEGYIFSPPDFRLFFDANDYDMSHEVRVKGRDDTIPDGDQVYSVRVRVVNTNDPNYQGLFRDVSVTNIDNESPYDPPPEANLVGDLILDEGQEGAYYAQESYPLNAIISFEWDWEYDGVTFDPFTADTGMNETHTWMDHSNFIVAVRVTDFLGYQAIDTLVVTVNDLVPSADFFWHQGAPEEGDTVNFQDNSTSYPDIIIGYQWDFSGLGTSTAMNPAFTFINNGNFTVTLKVTDEDSSEDTISKVINIADKDPVAGFSAAPPLQGEAPLTINFTDDSDSHDGIISYAWDFGDENTATGIAPPPHTYNAVGTYTVSLTVTEADGDTDTEIKSNYITVDNSPPTAEANGPYSGGEGDPITFSSAGSGDVNGDPITYAWDFGDGGSSNVANPTHTYAQEGSHTVILTVNDGSLTDVDTAQVTVYDKDPVAKFFADPNTGKAPLTVNFTDNSESYDSIISYSWNFGDGNTATGIITSPTHTYNAVGTYNVSLTVNEADGDTDTAIMNDYIIILPPDPNAPTAEANGPYSGGEGDPIIFSSAGSGDVSDLPITYAWDFGDGGSSDVANPTHTYAQDGNYMATLIVDNGFLTGEDTAQVTVDDKDPVADFYADANTLTGGAPLTVSFTDNSDSYDSIISYSWDFGDGNTATGIIASPNHTYSTGGVYTVSLTVAEGDGDTDTATKDNYVTVGCTNNDECLTGAYCQKAIGDCDGQGECTDRPASCPEGWDPVCGCDRETYTNECKAAELGISIGYIGECKGLTWPCKGHDFRRTGQSPYLGAQTSTLYWTYEINAPVISSPAIDDNGTIYIGSDDGNLYALNPNAGDPNNRLKWSYETGGGGIGSSPAIDANGIIYFGSNDGKVYALNPDGSLKWDYQTNGAYNYSSPAIDADGTIYIGSNDGNVYAFNVDGSLKWGYQTVSASLNSSPAIGTDGTIYIGGSSPGRVYALNPNAGDPNDRLKWSYETGADTFVAPAIDANGIIYIGCSLGRLHALDPNVGDPNDRLKWSYETGFEIASTPAIGEDGTIYIGSGDGRVYALNDNGTLKWRYQTGDQIIWSSPAIGADGTIYIGSGDGRIYALDEDGTLKWRYQTGDPFILSSAGISEPAIDVGGTVYTGEYGSFQTDMYSQPAFAIAGWGSYQTGGPFIFSSPAIGEDGTVYIGAWEGMVYAFKDKNFQAVNLHIDRMKMQMISFVHQPYDKSALSVFGEEVRQKYHQYEALFMIGTYDPRLGDYIEYGENLIIKPGRGYWCYARNGLNISFNGVPVNPDYEVELLFDPNTNDGWNMIACPHNTNYLWDDVQVSGCDPNDPNAKSISELAMANDCNCVDRRLWKWRNETYVYYDPDPNSTCGNEPNRYERDPDPYMRPNVGYWVRAKKADVYLSFPPLPISRVKDSHPDILISDITSREKESPPASGRPASVVSDTPPAPLGGFRSNGDGFSGTGSGGCFINNIFFGLPGFTR